MIGEKYLPNGAATPWSMIVRTMLRGAVCFAVSLCGQQGARACDACNTGGQSATESKESYSLFNRTPEHRMRRFATDRPDKTESAYSVDAGHIMHETDLINYTYNQDGGVRSDSFFLMAPNAKVGLTNATDIQFIYQPYSYRREKDVASGTSSSHHGGGDLLVRLKTNMWGNDSGSSAGAVMPYIKLPTAGKKVGNGAVEGGILFPFALGISDDTNIGAMTQIDILRNDGSTDYYGQIINSLTCSTALVGELSGYAEIWTALSYKNDPKATLDFGLTYMLTPNVQLDAGLNVGVTAAADDLNPFIGVSQRW